MEIEAQETDSGGRSQTLKRGPLGENYPEREREKEKEILPCESVCGVVESWDLQQFVVCVIYSSDLIRRKWHCLSWQRKKEMERM
jgi:hypothetical protein